MARSAAIQSVVDSGRIGSFRLVSELGEGGFAPVFLATEEYGGAELRSVALKLFANDDLTQGTASMSGGAVRSARERILEEARALCRVEHPNIVRFFQIVEDDARGVIGLAMEHVRGTSLADRLGPKRLRLSAESALALGSAVANALAAVHAVGLVHRDVKPGNVIDAGGVYKLIDFGIARAQAPRRRPPPMLSSNRHVVAGASHSNVSVSAVSFKEATDATLPVASVPPLSGATHEETDVDEDRTAGTMGYIDPACLGSKEPADAQSDLYALGAMLYECLTGLLPASSSLETPLRLRYDVVLGTDRPPAVGALAPSVPPEVARFVDSLVAPTREERPRRAEAVASEIERLRRVLRGQARPLPGEGPFRGLEPFDARHRDVYCGRATDIATTIELLRTRGVVALVGASGSGKSSLARAGVLPAIADGALGTWPTTWATVTLSPGRFPKSALVQALGPLVDDGVPPDAERLASKLAAHVDATGEGLAILIDAAEELVTMSAPAEAAWIERFLSAIAHSPVPGLRVVATARADLLDGLLATRLGPALARGLQLVSPLTPTAWLGAVEERVAAYGFALEPDLQRELARELEGAATAMPLVEFALLELWNARDVERKVLGRAALARMGGLGGALANHAEATLATLLGRHGPRAGAVTGEILVALTTPHGTRAKPTKAELAARVPDPLRDTIVAALATARLVVANGDEITLAHDALVTRWPRLHAWVESLRRDRELAAEIEEAAKRWRAHPERDAFLRGRALDDARALASSGSVALGDAARALVSASRRAALRSSGGVIALFATVVLAGLVLGGLYWVSERETRREKRRAEEITRSLLATRDLPQAKVAKDVEALVAAKFQCEKDLARCQQPSTVKSAGTVDAGTPIKDRPRP